MTTTQLTVQIPDDHDPLAVVEEVVSQINRGMTSGYHPTWSLDDVKPTQTLPASLAADAALTRFDRMERYSNRTSNGHALLDIVDSLRNLLAEIDQSMKDLPADADAAAAQVLRSYQLADDDTLEVVRTAAAEGILLGRQLPPLITSVQYGGICAAIDRAKTDDRSLDTDEYASMVLAALGADLEGTKR